MRLVGDKLSARWGKPVVIENKPGGDGLVSINTFLSSNDDHVLLYFPVGTFATHPYTHEKLTYDSERDLIPIAGVTSTILAAGTPSSMKATTLRALVDQFRAEPNQHNAAAANGNADFLLSGLLKTENLEVAKVPYRDIMQAPNDVAEGRIQLLMSSLASMLPLAQAGKIRVLAVTSRKRLSTMADVPTVAEAGFPGLTMESLQGMFGPRGMPLAVREQIAADVRSVVEADPTIAQRLAVTGQAVDLRTPQGVRCRHQGTAGPARQHRQGGGHQGRDQQLTFAFRNAGRSRMRAMRHSARRCAMMAAQEDAPHRERCLCSAFTPPALPSLSCLD